MPVYKAIDYAISALLRDDLKEFSDLIAYTSEEAAEEKCRIVILPSNFFDSDVYGTKGSLPELPLKNIKGIPVLFGSGEIRKSRNSAGKSRIILGADIVASAFFMLTRYEEIIRREIRDEHGRFPGKESLAWKCGFLFRPIVDEYSQLIREILMELGFSLSYKPQKYNKIYLTHDVDSPFTRYPLFKTLKTILWTLKKKPAKTIDLIMSMIGFKPDPLNCFDWIIEKDNSLIDILGREKVLVVYFFLAGGDSEYDEKVYLSDRRVIKLYRKLSQNHVCIGLHSSYSAGNEPHRIRDEKERLMASFNCDISWNRHHYLTSNEPEDLTNLANSGISDDFTMGYPDVAGFRLGTSQSIKWFDPVKLETTDLTIHPLIIMECTLDREKYMGLDYEDARDFCFDLLLEVEKHNGDVCLLWHNTQLSMTQQENGSYQRRLYTDIIDYLKSKAC